MIEKRDKENKNLGNLHRFTLDASSGITIILILEKRKALPHRYSRGEFLFSREEAHNRPPGMVRLLEIAHNVITNGERARARGHFYGKSMNESKSEGRKSSYPAGAIPLVRKTG
jgi:hypothetical protein